MLKRAEITKDKSDDALVKLANKIQYFRGSKLNVLDRIMQPLKKIKPDVVVRITGDDILIDNENFQISLIIFYKVILITLIIKN